MLFDNLNIYADIASNHHGDLNILDGLFDEIIAAGAIPKIQLWSPETFNPKWKDYLLLHPQEFVPSVFRPADVDFILPYQPLALKVASVESTYWELIRKCLETDLPLIVSTGGMDDEELFQLIDTVQNHLPGVCLMHCVSLYPTEAKDLNLLRIASMAEALEDTDIELGWSSHWPHVNSKALTMAYCYGATQFEVHVRWDLGYEHKATLDERCALLPDDIKLMRGILEDLHIFEGSEDIIGPDRDFVVEHRQRWQAKT